MPASSSPTYETVRIGDLLHESIESVKSRKDGRPVTFRDKLGPIKDATATLDPLQYRAEVVVNILTNAAQAIPMEEGGTVTLGPARGRSAHILVSDTGVGIDPDILPHVFEPFFTSKSKGTGLVFACRELVALHNGSINIESEPGRNTTVTVIFPPGNRAADG